MKIFPKIPFRFTKKKVFYSWLFSYLAIVMIAVIVISVVYFNIVGTIEREIYLGNEQYMRKLQKIGDSRLDTIKQLSAQIGMDKALRSVLYAKANNLTPRDRINLILVRDYLNIVYQSSGLIDQLYVYFKGTDYVLDNEVYIECHRAYKLLHGVNKFDLEQYRQLLSEYHKGDFINNLNVKSGSSSFDAITYLQSLPVENVGNSALGTVVIQFNRTRLDELLKNAAASEKDIIILLNEDGNIFSSTGPVYLSDIQRYTRLSRSDFPAVERYGSKKVVVSSISSDIQGFYYLSIAPYNVFMERLNEARFKFMLGIISIIFFGAVAASFLVRKNYYPINNIVDNITGKLGLTLDEEKNELHFIQKVLDNTIDENEKILNDFKKHSNVLKAIYLTRLLRGRIDESLPVEQSQKNYGIYFPSDDFAVILLHIDEYETENKMGSIDKDDYSLIQFVISNVFEELINQQNRGYVVELDEKTLACIVCFNETGLDDEARKQQLLIIINEAQKFLSEKFNIEIFAAVSNVHKTVKGLALAYDEALNAMEYRLLSGGNKSIFYEDIPKNEHFYKFSIETEYKLTNYIKQGDFNNAMDILNQVFDENLNSISLSPETGECLIFDLLSSIVKIVDDNEYLQDIAPVSRLKKCETIYQMKEEMTDILEHVCSYFTEKNKVKNEHKLSTEIIQFINENYHDENMNVANIGGVFNITPNYLSRLFKRETGEGLHNYIERVRIEKAKEMLRSSNLTVNEIAEKTGFTNNKTFIRVFKKLEGTTPGKYRELSH